MERRMHRTFAKELNREHEDRVQKLDLLKRKQRDAEIADELFGPFSNDGIRAEKQAMSPQFKMAKTMYNMKNKTGHKSDRRSVNKRDNIFIHNYPLE